ncbi:unnamed protein product, partial [Closterium sp. Naga37s-1]
MASRARSHGITCSRASLQTYAVLRAAPHFPLLGKTGAGEGSRDGGGAVGRACAAEGEYAAPEGSGGGRLVAQGACAAGGFENSQKHAANSHQQGARAESGEPEERRRQRGGDEGADGGGHNAGGGPLLVLSSLAPPPLFSHAASPPRSPAASPPPFASLFARAEMEGLMGEGTTLVVDRYSFSGIAFSAAKGLDVQWCKSTEVGLPAPDIVIYLHIDPQYAAERGGYGGERYEKVEFQQRVGQHFHALKDDTWV